MAAHPGFTDEQWAALLDAAPAIAGAMAVVAGSKVQTKRELAAFIRLAAAAHRAPPPGLLGELLHDLDARIAATAYADVGPEAIPRGLAAARVAGAILAVAADPAAAEAVRQWLLTVAQTVAAAAREGGVLRMGASRVSPEERENLLQIAGALGIGADRA